MFFMIKMVRLILFIIPIGIINDEEEAINAGIEDMLLRNDAYCIIEWAERAPGLLPAHYLQVDFILEDDNNRTLVLQSR